MRTKQTTSGTANHSDMEDCDVFLEEAYDMLFTLGLDLFEDEDNIVVTNVSQVGYKIPNRLVSLFEKIDKLILDLDINISKKQMAVYYKYMYKDKIICTIGGDRRKLDMCFNLPYGKMIDTNNLLRDVSNKGKHGVGYYMLDVKDDSNIDDMIDFLKQTINYYK